MNTQDELLEATLDFARFQSEEARGIAKIGLANYYAGAVLMPYGRFLAAAEETRHDLEILSMRFGASLEQVAHRLSTLQRPGAKGIPFFFVRVDQAGTITKRHSATTLQFARYGGACPLWNVHQAFELPVNFAPTGPNTRWRAVFLFGPRCEQVRRGLGCSGQAVCDWVGLRSQTCRSFGLCRPHAAKPSPSF